MLRYCSIKACGLCRLALLLSLAVLSLADARAATNLVGQGPGTTWTDVPGRVDVPGNGTTRALTDTNAPSAQKFYRVRVRLP
jgi:hypothetical protein